MEDAPAFFKFIACPVRDRKKLRIPTGFTKEYGSTVSSDHAYIRASRGSEYKVGLLKRGSKVWLTDGWKEFAQNYSLAYGHFLVFSYQGNSRFAVRIYDDKSCEIDYHNFDSQGSDEDESDDESSIFAEDAVDLERDMKNCRAYVKAKAFPCGAPNFIVAMNKSYVKKNSNLWIPVPHAQRWLKGPRDVTLECANLKGRTFTVRFTGGYFVGGWPRFVRANKLELGDVCKFELIKGRDTYRVHIFRHD